jgi:ubiquinone/menaquinone biosynthesis C-methylase UbiE
MVKGQEPLPECRAMSDTAGYVLGQSDRAARRLEVQDRHLDGPSEKLLDDLQLRPTDRVVELGCGPGGFSRRILRRLGPGGVLVGVDSSSGLLEQARKFLASEGTAKFEPIVADVAALGPWLDGADVVVGRAVLHHVPMAEYVVGRLRTILKPGTRVGFIEPDFRTPLARIAYLEATGRTDVAPLRVFATAINQLYQARRISPAIGATLGPAMEAAGFRRVRTEFSELPSDESVIENITMFYDEIRDVLASLGILSTAEVDEQQRLLPVMPAGHLPAVWGVHRVAAEV